MTNVYSKLLHIVLIGSLIQFVSCNQEPTLPATLIPPGCRLGLSTFVNEAISDSSVYFYDNFGYVLQSSTIWKEKGRVTRQMVSTYSYTDEHYLVNRTDRLTASAVNGQSTTSNGTYTYEYGGTPKRIQAIKRINTAGSLDAPLTITYQYTGDQLTQYTEVDGNGASIYQASFGVDGKLSRVQRPTPQVVDVANGLVSRTVNGKDTVRSTYDSKRQLISQDLIYGTINERVQRTLTYDGRQPVRTGELRLQGFPVNDLSGNGRSQSNLLTETTRRFRNGFLTETTISSYIYTYNAQGYPLGYSRSDGARARFYYTNCP